ncbi:MAG: NAD(P)H-binding protein, partial [Symploca sp. SIO3C6]|nr:NAD(P)H-binding protein [Symploca sp. SIO3C6]NER31649.1 NAD(P)H-binding protein [Symploca sp. SIO1C4]
LNTGGTKSKQRLEKSCLSIILMSTKRRMQPFSICKHTSAQRYSWGNLNFFWKYIMFGILLRKVFADHQRQENYVKHSGLDWTIVRPGAFVDGDRTGNYRHGFPGTDQTSKLKISRADVADFILKELADEEYIHKTPSLSY